MTLLDLAEYKALVTTSATDAAIELALASTEDEILEAIGPIGDQTEHAIGGYNQIMLGRRARIVLSVHEEQGGILTELDATDYELSASGGYIRRLEGGTHTSRRFQGRVSIVYEPYAGVNLRKSVQAELVALDVGDQMGSNAGQRTAERIGEWSETFATTNVSLSPADRRAQILARLTGGSAVFPYWTRSGQSSVAGPAGS